MKKILQKILPNRKYYWCAVKTDKGATVEFTDLLVGHSSFPAGTPLKEVMQGVYDHATTALANSAGNEVFIVSLNKV